MNLSEYIDELQKIFEVEGEMPIMVNGSDSAYGMVSGITTVEKVKLINGVLIFHEGKKSVVIG